MAKRKRRTDADIVAALKCGQGYLQKAREAIARRWRRRKQEQEQEQDDLQLCIDLLKSVEDALAQGSTFTARVPAGGSCREFTVEIRG